MAKPIIIGVDDREAQRAFMKMKTSVDDMLAMEAIVAKAIINKARAIVPVDTGETKKKTRQHVQSATKTMVWDHVGTETHYAPYIEFGIPSRPNYPIQPFMRPASVGNIPAITSAVVVAVKAFLLSKGISI